MLKLELRAPEHKFQAHLHIALEAPDGSVQTESGNFEHRPYPWILSHWSLSNRHWEFRNKEVTISHSTKESFADFRNIFLQMHFKNKMRKEQLEKDMKRNLEGIQTAKKLFLNVKICW